MDPMNDAALERDIERALTIDPSPEFMARVRTRIANEPSPSSRWFGWLFASAATAAVAALAVIAVFVASPIRRIAPARASLLASQTIAGAVVVPSVGPAHRLRRGFGGQGAGLHEGAKSHEDAGARFDMRETTALQRLIAGVRAARVDLTPLMKEAPMALQPVDNLVIPPITIEPLLPGGVEGERP